MNKNPLFDKSGSEVLWQKQMLLLIIIPVAALICVGLPYICKRYIRAKYNLSKNEFESIRREVDIHVFTVDGFIPESAYMESEIATKIKKNCSSSGQNPVPNSDLVACSKTSNTAIQYSRLRDNVYIV